MSSTEVLMVGWGYPPEIDGGLDIHVANLFQKLQKKGCEIDLALPEERAPEDKDGIISIESEGENMVQKARSISQKVAKIAEEYDIIHTHDWFGVEAGFKAKKYSDVKWVSTFHSLSFERSRNNSEKLEELERIGSVHSDQNITVSRKLADKIKSNFDVSSKVVHNGFPDPSYTGKDVKEQLGIEGDMILFVGRHAEQKGIENLLYGFRKFLEADDREPTLVIGGDGHLRESLEEFSEILGIEEKVVFTGFIPEEELGDYYKSADLFVSPSINEPFGLTITEALNSGTAVMATENGAEEVLPEGTVKRIKPNSNSIKEGLESYSGEKIEINRRSWEEMAEEVQEVYSSIS